MRAPCATVLALALLFAGCGGTDDDHDHDDHAAREAATDAAHADDVLRIDPEMLRDLRITTAAVEARPGGEGVTALGELGVDEDRYAEVGPAIPARIRELHAGVGDVVAAGEPLATLESVQLGRARGELLAARARAALARQTLARKRRLAVERIVPRREVEEAEAAAAAAEAELRAAAAALGALGVSGEDAPEAAADAARFVLRSPLAGTVIEREGVRGQVADPARPLFRVTDPSRLWLTVRAFERDAVRLRPGVPARVALAALPGRAFTGAVTLIGQRVDPASRTVPVRIELENRDGLLRPGMSASAWVPAGEAEAAVVAVPAAALQRLADGWHVFLPRGEGAYEMRPVGRGRDLGGDVEVLSGLRPGETVVVEGAFLLKAEAEKARGEGEHHEH